MALALTSTYLRVPYPLQETEREFKQGRRVEFSVLPELLGLVLGENGENVRRVKEETGVTRVVIDQ